MNSVVHFDMPAEDTERAQKFYKEVFGWGFMKAPGEMPYWFAMTTESDEKGMPKNPGSINGGMYKRQDANDYPVMVLNVDDLDAHIKKVEAAGGKVAVPKMEVGDMGWYAKVADTEGNNIGLWQNK